MIIGLTGGIASGKSTVSNYLKSKGFSIFDADRIAKDLLEKKEITNKIVKIFGEEILDKELKIDRFKLKELVFKNKKMLKKLNEILHPKVYNYYENIKKNISKGEIVIFDVPLLFEAGFENLCDKTLLIITDYDIQLDRIIKRDNISKDLAEKIISSQMSDEEKIKKADMVIKNNGSIEELKEKVKIFCEEIII